MSTSPPTASDTVVEPRDPGAPLGPVRREVLVRATPDDAYRMFLDGIGTWWPLAGFSVFGGDSTVVRDGDRIIERTTAGETSEWGRVLEGEAPHRMRVAWHPGHDSDRGTFDVEFTPGEVAGHTRVVLEHTGWESYGDDAAAMHENYRTGWPLVLAAFQARLLRA